MRANQMHRKLDWLIANKEYSSSNNDTNADNKMDVEEQEEE